LTKVSLPCRSQGKQKKKRRKYDGIARKSIQKLRIQDRCNPTNFIDKLLLLEAEFPVVSRGNLDLSDLKYYSAILVKEF